MERADEQIPADALGGEILAEGIDEGDLSDFEEAPVAGAGWRLAKSLFRLREEVNAFAPNRRKFNDGTIGDAAHAARASRHNPNNAGVVCALDITHDPGSGMDAHALARRLVLHPHPDLAYIISNRQGAYRKEGFKFRKYGGSHPHDKHIHVAVGVGPDSEPKPPYDDNTAWGVADPMPLTDRVLKLASPLMRGNDVEGVQKTLINRYISVGPKGVDGIYGAQTRNGMLQFQKRMGLPQDGVCDQDDWAALRSSETLAHYVDRVWLKPRKSLMQGDMITRLWEWYGIEPVWTLSITGAETSMGREADALSRVFNFGGIQALSPGKPWSEKATGKIVLNGRKWWVYPDAWTGITSWARLIKLEYLATLQSGGVAALAPRYYGETVPGYKEYLKNITAIETAVKQKLALYTSGRG